jgi:hypothetical protein
MKSLLVLLAAAPLVAACGGEEVPETPDGGAITCTAPASERLLPLAVGTVWTYRVTPLGGAPVEKTSTVEAYEDVGERKAGVVAYRVRTEKTDGVTVSWQEDRCTQILRHREQSFDMAGTQLDDQFYVPAKLRVDESEARLAPGVSWTTSYSEVSVDPLTGNTLTKSKTETWTVEAIDEQVTVPAGTFTTVRVRRVGQDAGQADKTFWFARGVGKVKEQGDQLEELVAVVQP